LSFDDGIIVASISRRVNVEFFGVVFFMRLQSVSIDVMTEHAHVPPALLLPLEIRDTGSYLNRDGEKEYDLEFVGKLNLETNTYELQKISVVRIGDAPLNGTTLRSVRVQDALGDVMRAADIRHEDDRPYEWPYDKAIAEGAEVYTPTRELPKADLQLRVDEAARLYAIAHAFGLPELREIQRAMALSQSTAGRLVKLARAQGLVSGD
jgi:hypothetical protein